MVRSPVSQIKEDHRMMLFKNRVLRKVFRRKRYEVTRYLRKWHIAKLQDFSSESSIMILIKLTMMRWAGHNESMGEYTNA
jgi:hypothetical protein